MRNFIILIYLMISTAAVAQTVDVTPIPSISGIASVVVYEKSGPGAKPGQSQNGCSPWPCADANTFAVNGPVSNDLKTKRSGQLTSSNRDFTGLDNEYYDIYLSDQNGVPGRGSYCVTIDAQYNANGNAHNITHVDLTDANKNILRRLDMVSYGSKTPLVSNTTNPSLDAATTADPSSSTLLGNTTGNSTVVRVGSLNANGSVATKFNSAEQVLRITLCSRLVCPPVLSNAAFKKMFTLHPQGTVADLYRLSYSPDPAIQAQMQKYLNTSAPNNAKRLVMSVFLDARDPATEPSFGSSPQPIWNANLKHIAKANRFAWWDKTPAPAGASFVPSFWLGQDISDPQLNPQDGMAVGRWYRVMTYFYFEGYNNESMPIPANCNYKHPAFFIGLGVE